MEIMPLLMDSACNAVGTAFTFNELVFTNFVKRSTIKVYICFLSKCFKVNK